MDLVEVVSRGCLDACSFLNEHDYKVELPTELQELSQDVPLYFTLSHFIDFLEEFESKDGKATASCAYIHQHIVVRIFLEIYILYV